MLPASLSARLPDAATPYSQTLYAFALTLIQACPASLYDEAAVSGSVARGRADRFSDCEIPFWSTQLQDAAVYKTWMESLRPDVKLMRESLEPGTALYLEYAMEGVKVCTIWQTWDRLEEIFTALQANRLPHDPAGPWMLSHLIPVSDAPRLRQYGARIREYPDNLRRSLIEKQLEFWRWKLGVADVFLAEAAAHRRHLYDLRTRQMTNINSILHILFAYNRQWLPDAKWYNEGIQVMPRKPEALIERIDRLLTEADPVIILPAMRALMLETMHLIADQFTVADIIAGLETITFVSD